MGPFPEERAGRPDKVHAAPKPGMPVCSVMKRTTSELTLEGRQVPVSNQEKVLYPATGFTKGDVVQYYIAIAPVLLPHLKGRALTMKRYPNGVDGFFFYEKQCPPHRPDWVETAEVFSEKRGENMLYCVAADLPTLVWAANLADLELHTSLARVKKQDRPTSMVFDLDPGPGTTIVNCAQVALWLREKLEQKHLDCVVKTSGSKGIQLYVPLNTSVTFDDTRTVSHDIAEALGTEHPDQVVINMRKDLRKGKVLIDWSQNNQHKTTVCAYSLRATQDPSVSTPLEWAEVENLLKTKKPESVRFSPDAVIARVKKKGDLFEPALTLKQKLTG